MTHYSSFIVRIWSDQKGHFHGQVIHVATQEKRHFRDMDHMIEFILQHLNRAEANRDSAALRTFSTTVGKDDGDE